MRSILFIPDDFHSSPIQHSRWPRCPTRRQKEPQWLRLHSRARYPVKHCLLKRFSRLQRTAGCCEERTNGMSAQLTTCSSFVFVTDQLFVCRILPLLFVTYMFQYLDKSTMANTAILGLRTDLNLHGQDYSWASSMFNFGYLAASAPVAFIIVRFPISKFMAVSVLV